MEIDVGGDVRWLFNVSSLSLILLLVQALFISLPLLTLYRKGLHENPPWRFVFSVSLSTLSHTRTHFRIIFFSRQSQSCQCQMLICHAAAGGFSRLPWVRWKNYLIKNLLLLYNNFTLHSACTLPDAFTHLFVGKLFQKTDLTTGSRIVARFMTTWIYFYR